ncbi:TetR/AcrR family transcriptional regulator, partial [Streptomyces boncukensis]
MTHGSRTSGERGTSVWLERRPAPVRRRAPAVPRQGGEPGPEGLDRERITATAVRLLDAGGLGGFSMRRLAAELGVTAMSVYWYVDSKDDLLELALDAVQGELPLPPESADAGADTGPDTDTGPGPEGGGVGWRRRARGVAYEVRG